MSVASDTLFINFRYVDLFRFQRSCSASLPGRCSSPTSTNLRTPGSVYGLAEHRHRQRTPLPSLTLLKQYDYIPGGHFSSYGIPALPSAIKCTSCLSLAHQALSVNSYSTNEQGLSVGEPLVCDLHHPSIRHECSLKRAVPSTASAERCCNWQCVEPSINLVWMVYILYMDK